MNNSLYFSPFLCCFFRCHYLFYHFHYITLLITINNATILIINAIQLIIIFIFFTNVLYLY
nr:MAG TPA: hypothetical protein [Caudoviricetes sp.]